MSVEEKDMTELSFKDDGRSILLPVNEDLTITFNCEKVVLQPNEVMTDWPDGFPLDFNKYEVLVFKSKKQKVTYRRVNTEEK